jgi:hypothetical protein
MIDLELGAGVGKHKYVWAITSVLVLEVASRRICIDVELGKKG